MKVDTLYTPTSLIELDTVEPQVEAQLSTLSLLDNTRNFTQQWWLSRQWQTRFLWPVRNAHHQLFPGKQGHPKLLPHWIIDEIKVNEHTYSLQDLIGDITIAQGQGLIPAEINFDYLQSVTADQFQEWKKWLAHTGFTQNDHYLPMVEFLSSSYQADEIVNLQKEFETLHSLQTPESFVEFILDERHYHLYLIMQEAHRNWRNQTYHQNHPQPAVEAMTTDHEGFLQILPTSITNNLKMRLYSIQYSLKLHPQGANIENTVSTTLRQIVTDVRGEVQSNPSYPPETSFYLMIELMQQLLKLNFNDMSINATAAKAGRDSVLNYLMQELKADANSGIFAAAATK